MRLTRRRALAAATIALAAACTAAILYLRFGEPRIEPMTTASGRRLTGLCAAAVKRLCAKRIECGQMQRAQRSACIDEMGAECERSLGWKISAGVVSLGGEPQNECLEGISEASCNALQLMLADDEPGLFEITDRCELPELLHARSGLGGACGETADCTSGFCPGLARECHRCRKYVPPGGGCRPGELECDPARAYCAGAEGAMVCRPLGAEGARCAGASECRTGVCRAHSDGTRACAAGAAGVACSEAGDCEKGFYCHAESGGRVCAPRVKTGDSCDDEPLVCAEQEASCVAARCRVRPFLLSRGAVCREFSDCEDGLYCKATADGLRKGRCVAKAATGGACELRDFGACRIDSICVAGHCRHLAEAGQRCGGSFQCKAFLSCVPSAPERGASGTCTPNPGVGEACTPHLPCTASFCDPSTGKCVPLATGGARCQRSEQCESQWCVPGALVCYAPCGGT